jgi:probable F420-dependent oxidoreductase
MRFGLHALGIGSGADPAVITAVAGHAEDGGFATLWAGEHVVMVDRADSPYPYSDDGRIAVPSDADWLDPFLALTFAAAASTTIRLGTGILLLPQHNPLVVAKQAATLDVLSGGRFVLGVGVGWSREEFAALGSPFRGRSARNAEYVEAMRTLWHEDVASFHGDSVHFDEVRSYPKPVRDRRLPVFLGGNSDRALARVAAYGDGWYGFNLARAEVAERMGTLAEACREEGRDPASVEVSIALRDGEPGDVAVLVAAGVSELVLVESPPEDPTAVAGWVAGLVGRWGIPAH